MKNGNTKTFFLSATAVDAAAIGGLPKPDYLQTCIENKST